MQQRPAEGRLPASGRRRQEKRATVTLDDGRVDKNEVGTQTLNANDDILLEREQKFRSIKAPADL